MTISNPCPHTDDTPLLALGALDEHEAASLRAHAATCEECRRSLAEHDALVGQLDMAFAREPAPAFEDLVFARPPVVAPRPARAAAAHRLDRAFAGARRGCGRRARRSCSEAARRAPRRSRPCTRSWPAWPRAARHASSTPTAPTARSSCTCSDVPTPPKGTYYAVWVLPRGEKTMEAIGTFVPRGSPVDLKLSLPGSGDYQAVDISIQRVGGPSAHSGTSLAGGAFRAT